MLKSCILIVGFCLTAPASMIAPTSEISNPLLENFNNTCIL